MGLELKRLQMCFLFLFCGWVAVSQGTGATGPCVRISVCTILHMAKHSMTDSHILDELAEAATKNQGGNKAIKGIKGLKVKDIQKPNITLEYEKAVGMKMIVGSQITIAGKSFIGGTMEITVKSNMTTLCKLTMEKGKMNFIMLKCGVDLISCKTNLPSSMLPKIVNKFLNSTLGKVLPGMMCPAADKVVVQMKKQTEKMTDILTCGNRGSVQYFLSGNPEITEFHARICFQAHFKLAGGKEPDIFDEPSVLNDLSELEQKNSLLTLPDTYMNRAMGFYRPDLDQDVTSDTMPEGGPVISGEALKGEAPTMEFPDSYGSLKFKMKCDRPPKWTLDVVATLTVSLTIELVEGPQENSMFVLSVELKILATFKVVEGNLQTLLGDHRLENLQRISSAVGDFDPELLSNYLLDLISVTVVRALKTAMQDAIPLPSMMGSRYEDVDMQVHPNALRAIITSECE